MTIAEVRKFIVTICGALVVVGNQLLNTAGVIPDNWSKPINIVIVIATAILTYLVPNATRAVTLPVAGPLEP